MADIQSVMAENRQGKKKERRKNKPQDENIMACSIPYGGHKELQYGGNYDKCTKATKI